MDNLTLIEEPGRRGQAAGSRPALVPTNISWATHVLNPLLGCSRVSQGCRFCWAELLSGRLEKMGLDRDGVVEVANGRSRWTRRGSAADIGKLAALVRRRARARVFLLSMSDLAFDGHSDDHRLATAGAILASRAAVRTLTLTKRPEAFLSWLARWWALPRPIEAAIEAYEALVGPLPAAARARARAERAGRMPDRWWWGVSVEDAAATSRLGYLRHAPAAVRWVSAEPLLEAWDPTPWADAIDWLVLGGESGLDEGVRPCDLVAMRVMALQAERAGIPLHMKQIGSRPTGLDRRVFSVRHPHGGRVDEWPAWLPTTRALPAQWGAAHG